jgi:hypothetical protein
MKKQPAIAEISLSETEAIHKRGPRPTRRMRLKPGPPGVKASEIRALLSAAFNNRQASKSKSRDYLGLELNELQKGSHRQG